ncbi:MAG: isoaspartyl peptidase/L-asparaginase [Chitinophagaceae bacterium]|nr:isoaspartyl peptidase/L-asparaginase [Chitinophagaceae bacterium]
MKKFSIAIHGGAGTILKKDMTKELESAYLDGLREALLSGYTVLENGGTSLLAVETAVSNLENNILFNAGRGSVFSHNGLHEMDAAIMNGKTLDAGAVAGVTNIANPIKLAMLVMQNSEHVLLSGQGANDFATEQGFSFEQNEYFFSQLRYDQWQVLLGSDNYALDHSNPVNEIKDGKKFGTVGAVAYDQFGNVAASTSTGGMTNKKYGRIGDSPLIGCGTYANNKTCAISCTGHGEPFIKAVAAYDVSCLMEYKGMSLQQAMNEVVHVKLVKLQGEGGMIGVDSHGDTAMIFNSAGMYRASKSSDSKMEIAVYK